MNKKTLKKYAELIVRTGANVQQGQPVSISSSVELADFTALVAEEAYLAGASKVSVEWSYGPITKYSYQYRSIESLTTVPNWIKEKANATVDEKTCFIHIVDSDPSLLASIDPNKIKQSTIAMQKATFKIREATMKNDLQWTIASIPTKKWAKKVFPKLDEDKAYDKLFNLILKVTRVSGVDDPVAAWDKHNKDLQRRNAKLNSLKLDSLVYKSSNGTNLEVGLVDNHIWAGGCDYTTGGIVFNPNLPTEEAFTMPHKYRINGKLISTMPLLYAGKLIDKFWLEFKDGKVVSYGAKKNYETLKTLVEFDEGSCRLGEVALVPYDSPISNSGVLFYNTLFDENASCHFALGRAYPSNIEGGNNLNPDQADKVGMNHSMTHVDFMVGAKDLSITGYTKDGKAVPIFIDGNWAF